MTADIALVGVEKTAFHFDERFSYRIPDEWKEQCRPGCRVLVNFGFSGKTRRQAIVLETYSGETDKPLKPVLEVLDREPMLNAEMLGLLSYIRETTFCTYFDAAKLLLPAGSHLKTEIRYAVSDKIDEETVLSFDEARLVEYLREKKKPVAKDRLYAAVGLSKSCMIAETLAGQGILTESYEATGGVGDASVKSVRLLSQDPPGRLTEKQQTVVDFLRENGTVCVKEVCYYTGVSASVLSSLEKKGVVALCESTVYRIPKAGKLKASLPEELVLTDEQERAYRGLLTAFHSEKGETSLLFGVTGSGKTSVFMKLIDRAVEEEKGVIVMVPEISLTPQLLSLFKGRYGKKVALFHSALSVGERRDEYLRVKNGEALIAVGTRSAVFAPFETLGLIVIDEEQEATYKSEMTPRYDAKNIARFRAAYHKALVVLSSATPSVESYSYAMLGKYGMETIRNRYANAKLPEVVTVDLREDRAKGNKYDLSEALIQALAENLQNKKQSILLINRRGCNTFLACDSCGAVLTCPSCSISLTYHSANGRMMCHYCGYSAPAGKVCPECGKESIRFSGYGTQRIEDELKALLPEARVLRMDTDTTMSRFSHESKLAEFEEGKYDILLGTQMVAKGLDFENVTLVGVVSADGQLNSDDFRSMERTFDLLTQVVGRAGRGNEHGRAFIQTLTPENNVIRLAAKQDYEAFYSDEIEIRRYLKYPPFCDLCTVTFSCADEPKASLCARLFLKDIEGRCAGEYAGVKLIVLGPMAPRMAKLNDRYRFRLIIKCKNNRLFRSMMSGLLIEYGKKKEFSDVSVTADMNPTEIN